MDDTKAAEILQVAGRGESTRRKHRSPRVAPPAIGGDLKRALFMAVDALEQRTRLAARAKARYRAMRASRGPPRRRRAAPAFDSGLAVEALAARTSARGPVSRHAS